VTRGLLRTPADACGRTSKRGLYTVSDRGGTPEPLTIDGSEKGDAQFNPISLPSGDLLYMRARKGGRANEIVITRKSGPSTLVKGGTGLTPLSVGNGYMVYGTDAGLAARAFDSASATLIGDPLIIGPGGGWASASLSADGTLVYRMMTGGSQQLEWIDRAGGVLGSIGQAQEVIERLTPPAADADLTALAQRRRAGFAEPLLHPRTG
jgi:hypothetical protein